MDMEIVNSRLSADKYEELYSELLRKSIHMAVAFVPLFATLHVGLTIVSLAVGVLFYTWAEGMRLSGRSVPVVTSVTRKAARSGDAEGMILGPVTLALGAMLALLLYPDPVSFIAIYALAFGDGFASLVGRLWGRFSLPFNPKKTIEGSAACLIAVFLVTYGFFDHTAGVLAVAVTAAFIESLSLGDMDNMLMPFGVGLVAEMALLG